MISCCAHLPWKWLVGITFTDLVPCSAISSAALIISTKKILRLYSCFNLIAFERQQLDEIWPYILSIIIGLVVYNSIFSSSNLFVSKVQSNIDVMIYGAFGHLFLVMKSFSFSQCLTSVYKVYNCLEAGTQSLPFNTQWITTMNIVFDNSGRLLLACQMAHTPKSVAGRSFPRLAFFLSFQISLAHRFKSIWTHCQQIHSAESKTSNSTKFLSVSKTSATTNSQCRGPSRIYFKQFFPQRIYRSFFSWNGATYTILHLLNAL